MYVIPDVASEIFPSFTSSRNQLAESRLATFLAAGKTYFHSQGSWQIRKCVLHGQMKMP